MPADQLPIRPPAERLTLLSLALTAVLSAASACASSETTTGSGSALAPSTKTRPVPFRTRRAGSIEASAPAKSSKPWSWLAIGFSVRQGTVDQPVTGTVQRDRMVHLAVGDRGRSVAWDRGDMRQRVVEAVDQPGGLVG
jgi:hypothetical protein